MRAIRLIWFLINSSFSFAGSSFVVR